MSLSFQLDSSIIFLSLFKSKEAMEILGKDYCLLQAKFEFDGFLYQSEPLIAQKKTGIVKSEDIDLDYLGNPVKNRTFDPSQLIDASSGTIMPIFQKATFVH